MSHHGQELDSEEFRKMFNEPARDLRDDELSQRLKGLDQAKQEVEQKFGATGLFPDGQLNNQDEGEIRIGITSHQGKVIVDFGEKPIKWIGFTREQAFQIANSLIEKGLSIPATKTP